MFYTIYSNLYHFSIMDITHTLSVDSLSYTVANKKILHAVYLAAITGDILIIKGRNGTGKSTLMKILFGIITPDFIYININNKVITNKRHLNKYISYKPQLIFFPKHLKLKDVISAVEIEQTSFAQKMNTKLDHLSSGEQQFIQTLYVLNLPQPICLLDEPFAGISPLLQEFLAQVIKQKAKHKIILLTDHNADIVNTIATKTLHLENGVLKEKSSNE
ncbi:ATP-binding cassette domain-containing protein [Myroides sp.]|uniref:ATP-binding cassette domain-containing protein n=1 Tax=Myroides sp. TaxID=1874736 RepID=UPI003F37BA96